MDGWKGSVENYFVYHTGPDQFANILWQNLLVNTKIEVFNCYFDLPIFPTSFYLLLLSNLNFECTKIKETNLLID